MFFIKRLTETILLHPSYFGPSMIEYLKTKLHQDVEGTCSGRMGYIISVLTILDIGAGLIVPGTGQAQFKVEYNAIVFKPFKNEVVDGVVNNVSKMGIFLDVGPLSVFVSSHHVSAEFVFDPKDSDPAYTKVSDNGGAKDSIRKGVKLRVKLIGTRVDATEIFAIGSIKDDYLGLVNDLPSQQTPNFA